MSKKVKTDFSKNGHDLVPDSTALRQEFHPEGRKRLSEAIEDFSLTMQHAIRANLAHDLAQRAKDEAGILPALTVPEMFDFLVDSDDDFLNWCFPFCALKLTTKNLGYLHHNILRQFRLSLEPNNVTDHADNE